MQNFIKKFVILAVFATFMLGGVSYFHERSLQKQEALKAQAEIAEAQAAIEDMQMQIRAMERQSMIAPTVGSDATPFVGGDTYNLSGSGVSASASSIGLTSFTIRQTGQELITSDFGSYVYGTIEPGSPTRKEFVKCTTVTQGAGTAATLSGCSRGLSPIYPYTASTTLQFAHSGAAPFIISNSPAFYANFAVVNNNATITAQYVFPSTTPPKLDYNPTSAGWTALSSTTLITLGKLADTVLSGAVAATTLLQGYVEIATSAEVASSTATGGTGANLVIAASMATDTPTYGCNTGFLSTAGSGCLVTALLDGKISPRFIATSSAYTYNFGATMNFTGPMTYSGATSTFNATTTGTGRTLNANLFITMSASTTITATTPIPVYISTSTNTVLQSDANVDLASTFLGFAVTSVAATGASTTVIQTDGIVPGFTGLTKGQRYYVQDAVGTIGTSIGTNEVFVGTAVSTTEVLIQRNENTGLQYLGSTSGTAIPLLARMVVINSTGSYTCAGGGGTVQVQHTLFITGVTSATDGGNTFCDGNSAADLRFSITSSISGRTLSVTQSGMTSVSYTAYFYR